ncbi:MAG: hypothetical protein HUK23_07655 [Sphaerochaetaceae bacterium]|nr:hypothetical protein [Sphaerochaetaceae bacterium]
MKKLPLTLLLLILLLVLSSCVVAEKLTLKDDLSGKSHIDLSVDDFFIGVIEDLSNWTDKGNSDPILDVAVSDFVKNLEKSSTTSSIKFIETGYNSYLGDFNFSDFEKLVQDLSNNNKDQSLIKISKNSNKTLLEIHIGMDNYQQLTDIIPFLADPNFEVYGPLYNHDLSEEEYLEMVSFILGEQCPDSINNSSIKIQVVAPKAISKHNGTLKNTKTVEFTLPLINFLLLHQDIYFYLEF